MIEVSENPSGNARDSALKITPVSNYNPPLSSLARTIRWYRSV